MIKRLLPLLIACGSAPTLDDYQRPTTAALCRYYTRCGWFSPSQEPFCERVLATQIANAGWSASEAFSAGRLTVDGATLPVCTAAIDAADCDLSSLVTLGPLVLDATTLAPKLITPYTLTACPGALVGKVPAGGSCKADLECHDGWCDNHDVPGCAGTCVAFSTDCGAAARCSPGSYCDPTNHCVPLTPDPGLGDSCPASVCAAGLYCDITTVVCRQPLVAGSPCTPEDECADGLSCTSAGCKAWSDIGGSCGEDADCAGDAFCDRGACKLWGQPGDDCSASNCAYDSYCNARDQCAQKSALGGSCETVDACLGGGCSGGTCALGCG